MHRAMFFKKDKSTKNLPVGGELQFCLQAIGRYVLEEDIICLHIITCGKPDKNSNLRHLALHQ